MEAAHPPSIRKAIEKVDQAVARLQELQNAIAITRLAILPGTGPKSQYELSSSLIRRLKHGNADSRGPAGTNPSYPVDWTQWSAPAQIVCENLSEIRAAIASGVHGVLDEGFAEETQLESIPEDDSRSGAQHLEQGIKEDASIHLGLRVADGAVEKRSRVLDEAQMSKFVSKLTTPGMKVTKVKQSQKTWKLSQMKPSKPNDAVMFPNLAYSPSSPPASSRHFRIVTPFKSTSSRKGGIMGNMQKVSKNRSQGSPVRTLPQLIDRLPSKKRAVRATANFSVPRSKELPYPPCQQAGRNVTRVESRKVTGRNAGQPFKMLESNATVAKKSQKSSVKPAQERRNAGQRWLKVSDEKTCGRARSVSPRRKQSAKENSIAGKASLKRSWSAGSGSLIGKANTGQSMLQRAKGWVLGNR